MASVGFYLNSSSSIVSLFIASQEKGCGVAKLTSYYYASPASHNINVTMHLVHFLAEI